MSWSVNGRFLLQPLTGVQRYAREILERSGGLEIVTAPPWARGARGHLWEQVALARHSGWLWSPCNTGPIAHPRQVVTLHDAAPFDCPEAFTPAFGRWYRVLYRGLGRRARALVTDTEFSRQRLAHWLKRDPESIHVIPLGVSERFAPAPAESVRAVKERLGLPQTYALTLGSLDPRKNVAFLEMLVAGGGLGELPLVVAGGANRGVFRTGALGGAGVQWLGRVAEEDLVPLYSGAALGLFPSRYEGFGLPALEAMACGVPVVASDIPAHREVLGEGACRVPLDEPQAWKVAVAQVQRDRAHWSVRGQERARAFTWNRTTEAVRALLNSLHS